MTATTEGRATSRRDGRQMTPPVAATTKIPVGVMVAINTSGLAVNGAATSSLVTVGVSEADADNTAGADAAIRVKVRRGCFKFGNSPSADQITLANVNANCYVVDNQTVAKTNNSGARPVAGVIRDVDTDGVWVEF